MTSLLRKTWAGGGEKLGVKGKPLVVLWEQKIKQKQKKNPGKEYKQPFPSIKSIKAM